jgi:hypothetical protein
MEIGAVVAIVTNRQLQIFVKEFELTELLLSS